MKKTCKICKEKFEPRKSSLEPTCQKYDCKVSFALIQVQKQRNKQEKEHKKVHSKKKAILKEKLKTLSDWKNELQKEINTIVRLIDKGHGCIATGAVTGKQNAGHYVGVQANPTTRYHLENIWLQSEHSNMWKSGDTLRYQDGITKLYGKDYLEYLNLLRNTPSVKLTVEQIKEKIPICRTIIKELKSEDRMFDTNERLSLRIKYNKMIGIY